jgi:hypothetical protein
MGSVIAGALLDLPLNAIAGTIGLSVGSATVVRGMRLRMATQKPPVKTQRRRMLALRVTADDGEEAHLQARRPLPR